MADLSLTALTPTAATNVFSGIAGETITEGEAVYLDANDGRLYLAIATGKASSKVVGLALNDASVGGPISYGTGIIDDGGAGLTEGLLYVLSGATAGDLSPHTDATTPASSEFSTFVGNAETSSRLHVNPTACGGQVA